MATLDLRQRYLKGDIKADALAVAARQTELKVQLARAQLQINLLRSTIEELHSHFAVGQASELDLKRAEVGLLERQLEMKRIQQELDALNAVKR
jgi:hypothetical protein